MNLTTSIISKIKPKNKNLFSIKNFLSFSILRKCNNCNQFFNLRATKYYKIGINYFCCINCIENHYKERNK